MRSALEARLRIVAAIRTVKMTKARSWSEGAHSFKLQYHLTTESLGRGTFGQVRKAISRANGEEYAVKVIHLGAPDGTLDEKTLAATHQEEHVMQRVGRHEHCVALLETFSDFTSQRFYFVMERCDSNAMDSIDYVLTCDDEVYLGLVADVAKAVAHIHKRGVIHRDIKPDNLLFVEGSQRRSLKLCDFGLAVVASKSDKLPGRYGTMPYMSPEMAASAGHSFSTDIWSLGATLYMLTFGDLPYRPQKMCKEHLKLAIITGCLMPSYEPLVEGLPTRPAPFIELIKQMLSRDRLQRPTAQRLVSHETLGMATTGSRVRQAICDVPGKLKAALQLKAHFGCWRAQKSEEDDILGKPIGLFRAVTN